MASTVVNTPNPGTIKLNRGRPANLGTVLAALNSVVQFTVPEPTYYNQGGLVIAVSNGQTGVTTYSLQASIDGGVSWFVVTMPAAATTSPFGDTVVSSAFGPININGFGSGALFRFGPSAGTPVGTAAVWALVG